MADELAANPPDGITYTFPSPTRREHRLIRSPIKSYLWEFANTSEFDILEAVLSPAVTQAPWICSLDTFSAAVAYSILGLPIPKAIRVEHICRLLRSEQCRRVVFWSQAARRTLTDYGGISDPRILDKCEIVYPAVRAIDNRLIRYSDNELRILFSGDFFRKGGANVIDAFEGLQREFPDIRLRVCCDENIDFNTDSSQLKSEYLTRIHRNSAIELGRVTRREMLEQVLPETDIYLLPTYNEAFGFAILEAMAYGIPVIATNVFAIPEILEHGRSGLLIDLSEFDLERMFRGYRVNQIYPDFHRHMNDQLTFHLRELISSHSRRRTLGSAALEASRSKFGFDARNESMGNIYRSCL